ncbi:vacuolar sorting-associated 51 homolog [Pelobates cultripes]|uniref:Vacuolar protein sorting-associated protein 51 homolog n=1 Tax=Pelobates cultripes TaxID=61616 RepID=A0AAD1WR93_PELCU|nr:vacuolar sorting-associated 51 homolog [Pelobates cultripes]
MAAAAAAAAEDEEVAKRRKAHGMLKLYYGITEEGKGGERLLEPTDIDGVHFDPELYLTQLRKERSLAQLMDVESDMVRQIRALDSDMQTLVYENYNKFISATDTIRKMKNDFKKMEDEMDGLAANMAVITEFSASISSTLQERHQHITKLSGVHTLLRKLQFLFELPARLNKCIELKAYAQAVSYHSKARSVLHQYQHMPSFHGIQTDCQAIMAGLADTLRQRFRDSSSSTQELSECVELLLSLEEPAHLLCDEFLAHGRGRLASHLSDLEGSGDVLEFVDRGCGGFISDSCLLAASYQALFCKEPGSTAQMAEEKLTKFLEELSEGYFELVEIRLRQEKSLGDNSLLVRALDRFHRRLQAPSKLVPGCGFNRRGTEIVVRVAQERLAQYLQALKDFFQGCLTDVRQALAAPRVPGKEAPALGELLAGLSASVLNQIKTVLAAVHLFTAKDVAFSDKPYFKVSRCHNDKCRQVQWGVVFFLVLSCYINAHFHLDIVTCSVFTHLSPVFLLFFLQGEFCSQGVREGLIVAFIKSICQTARQFCESPGEKGANTPPVLLLLLSRLCLDYETSTISYILTLTDEQFLGQVILEYLPAPEVFLLILQDMWCVIFVYLLSLLSIFFQNVLSVTVLFKHLSSCCYFCLFDKPVPPWVVSSLCIT